MNIKMIFEIISLFVRSVPITSHCCHLNIENAVALCNLHTGTHDCELGAQKSHFRK